MGKPIRDWMTISDAARYYKEATGLSCSDGTILRWIKKGKLSPAKIVYLLHARLRHSTWHTRKKWMDEFIKNMTESDLYYGQDQT